MTPSSRSTLLALLMAVVPALAQTPVPSQVVIHRPGKLETVTLDSTHFAQIKPGDTAVAQSQAAYLVPPVFFAALHVKDSTIKTLVLDNKSLHELAVRQEDSLSRTWHKLDRFQDSTYKELGKLESHADSLLSRSIRNTDQAIAIGRSIRRRSYLTATIIGATAGFIAYRTWWTPIAGAGAAIGSNYLLVDF